MNGTNELVKFQQANIIAAALGEMHDENVREKEETAKKKIKYQVDKVGKKVEQENKSKETKESIMPGLEKDVASGIDVVATLPNKRLR